jgi:hypothetical protein
MNDERFLSDWLKDQAPDGSDTRAQADRIMARIPDTPQRRRWWPLGGRPARRTARPVDDPSSESRRTSPMFSPTNAIAGIALAIAAASVFALAVQDQSSEDVVPAAAADAVVPVPLRVELDFSGETSGARETLGNGAAREAGRRTEFLILESSDPRFEGAVSVIETIDRYEGDVSVGTRAWRVEDETGAWRGTPSYTLNDRMSPALGEPGTTLDLVFVGEGGYQGLVAVLRSTLAPDRDCSSGVCIAAAGAPDVRLEGYILNTTELPAAPEPRSTAE